MDKENINFMMEKNMLEILLTINWIDLEQWIILKVTMKAIGRIIKEMELWDI